MSDRQIQLLRARWIFPIDQPLIEDGGVLVDRDQIRDVGPFDRLKQNKAAVNDLGDAAIIPGLVNTHTHLEFSNQTSPLGESGMNFPDWIRQVVAARSQAQNALSKSDSIRMGIEEALAAGTCAIGEIATLPIEISDYRTDAGYAVPWVTTFLEQLGTTPELLPERTEQRAEFLDKAGQPNLPVRPGLSPHAPYSVHPDLLDQICSSATSCQAPVAMHLAESLDELELIQNQSGKFVDLLKDFGSWNAGASHRSVEAIIKKLATTPRSLIIHGNYLTEAQLDLVAENRNQSVVFCPRTHHYFQHSGYPIHGIRNRSINLAVGTDSRASNPDLNLFEELKQVLAAFPDLPPHEVLAMGTLNGARALGIDNVFGSISAGKSSRLCFVTPESPNANSIREVLFGHDSVCRPIPSQSAF